jgi:6,7-dimethyl-8-ribityllumazine synthase
MRARWPGGVPATAGRLMASALILLTALLLVRVSARGAASEVCVGPVPVSGACTTGTSTASSTTESSAVSSSATATRIETGASATESPAGGATAPATAAASSGRPAAAATSPAASHFPPPPPPLPPPSPGSVPAAPEAVVQRIVLVPSASGTIAPGDTVEMQATLEAQRGTDIFAVPRVPVTFAIVAASGDGAAVIPARTSSGDTGVAVVRVRTGDLTGDTVVSATSGTASAQLALHTDLPVSAAVPGTSPGTAGARGGHRLAWAGVLAAAGILCAAVLGLARRQRRGIKV